MRYWISRSTGALRGPAPDDARVSDMRFDLTPDIVDLPGPIECSRWDGAAVVADPVLIGAFKARLLGRIDELALSRAALQVTTPQGIFRTRRDDIERYTAIGFAALFAQLSNQGFSITVRDIDGVQVPLDRDQTLRLLAAIGARYYAVLQQAETRKAQLLAATPEQLKNFDPGQGIG